ncbi:hypothetical protein SAMN04487769_2875 [Burkholderia sp. b14]|uniref:Uncharacterized protein n=1 Tax=Mycetohabitans sp. TaxID=2571162 RepID=A0A6B9HDE2_9BURK|nr:hypothetical protein [Mycetohabitans sp.]QGY72880.1 hypothetical protein [Mycetohabitans sp.]SIT69675.1 hypothetical protein SAMN04487768_1773 [Burkholderia sp. b13]SIT77774.1 hypothetical protein SAMN04487769_2875 [Burkholderia sp. b14]
MLTLKYISFFTLCVNLLATTANPHGVQFIAGGQLPGLEHTAIRAIAVLALPVISRGW